MPELTSLPEWAALTSLAKSSEAHTIAELFSADSDRVAKYNVSCAGLYLDYSKNRLSDEARNALFDLASAAGLESRRQAMFAGEKINSTEERAVLHTALRGILEPFEWIVDQV